MAVPRIFLFLLSLSNSPLAATFYRTVPGLCEKPNSHPRRLTRLYKKSDDGFSHHSNHGVLSCRLYRPRSLYSPPFTQYGNALLVFQVKSSCRYSPLCSRKPSSLDRSVSSAPRCSIPPTFNLIMEPRFKQEIQQVSMHIISLAF